MRLAIRALKAIFKKREGGEGRKGKGRTRILIFALPGALVFCA